MTRFSTIRTLICLASQLDMSIEYLDTSTAFLNADLNEEVYMDQPGGFVKEKDKVVV